jgi:hypothetical protein
MGTAGTTGLLVATLLSPCRKNHPVADSVSCNIIMSLLVVVSSHFDNPFCFVILLIMVLTKAITVTGPIATVKAVATGH